MTAAVEVFQLPDTDRELRTVIRDGEPWFVAADVCSALALGNPRSSVALLDDDERGVHTMDTPSGQQQMTVINEPGLYSLILRSRKAEAKTFKRWITHDVLPAIRKTGSYSVPQQPVMSIAPPRASFTELADILRIYAEGGVQHPDWIRSKSELLWAQATGTAPQIPAGERLLYVDGYLAERGMSSAQQKKVGMTFGKRLVALYRDASGGANPPRTPRDINNRVTPVFQYSERDRPLFDEVWNAHYAPKPAVTA